MTPVPSIRNIPISSRTTSPTDTILAVLDDLDLLGMLRATFQLRNVRVLCTQTASEAVQVMRTETRRGHPPSLVILDVTLRDRDGLGLGQELLQNIPALSLVFLTAATTIETKVRALLMGADDLISQPFEWVELVARIDRCLRRRYEVRAASLAYQGIEIDLVHARVWVRGVTVDLSLNEYRFLCVLVQARGQIVSFAQFAECLWMGEAGDGEGHLIKKVKLRLDAKLDRVAPGCKLIHSVPKVGYYLAEREPAVLPLGKDSTWHS